MIVFEPHGEVILEASCADDLSVVNSARVSFAKYSEEYNGRDEKLLRFLMDQRHGTPFEHNYLRFRVRAPMFVFWEWKRHRVASYNVESARYVELRPDFYIPETSRVQRGKPGKYTFEIGNVGQDTWLKEKLTEHSEQSFQLYQAAIDGGIAKEQARIFLPTNIYVEFIFSVNARSLMNFLSLRNHDSAMWEIQEYARVIEHLWSEVMPDTAKAFIENGRIAP
jgi:thymidylate synthase (FAD)